MKTNDSSNITTTTASHRPKTSGTQPELLTQTQMAERLGICRRTLHSWVSEGTVPMIKVRGYCRFDSAKVFAALERHQVAATSPVKSSPDAGSRIMTPSSAGH